MMKKGESGISNLMPNLSEISEHEGSQSDDAAHERSGAQLSSSGRNRLKRLLVLSLFILGLTVCVSSLLCILLLPTFVTQQISKRLVLRNNSLLLERWSKPNVPMYFKVWVFDVRNAPEVLAGRGARPQVRELGPFVFHLKRQKDVVSFAGDNLYYTERKIYHFSPELSCCAINTTVTIPNIPLVAVVDRALSYNLPLVGRFIPRIINRAIQSLREQLFVRKQVRELLFDGYEVDLLKMVSRIGSLVGLPQQSQKFAILKGRNNTWRPEQDGVWAINTGARDRRQFGRVASWNSYKQLPFWSSPACNTINGSDGTLFPPPIRRSEPLYIFNQELCRTVNLIYDRPSDIRAIKAYRFVLNPLNFAHTMTPSTGPLRRPMSFDNNALTVPATPATPMRPNPTGGVAQPMQATGGRASGSSSGQASDPLRPGASQQEPTVRAQPDVGVAGGAANRRWRSRQAGGATTTTTTGQVGQRTTGEAANQAAADHTQAQQERLIQAAQDAHLDRRLAQTRMNPFTCFCDRKSTNINGANVCELDGLIDLSKCTKQAQVIFGSMPHFYQSDPRLLRQVNGLEPNGSKHTTYLDIEPNTGLVLGGKRRVQLNLLIKHNNEVDGFENINDMLVPIIWFEESAMIPEESARKFRSLYTDRIRLVNIVLMTLFLAALGLLAIDARLMASHYSSWLQLKLNYSPSGKTAAAAAEPIQQVPGGAGGGQTAKQPSKRRAARDLCTAARLAIQQAAGHNNHHNHHSATANGRVQHAADEPQHDGYLRRASNGQLNLPLLAASTGQPTVAEPLANGAVNEGADKPQVELMVRYNDTLASAGRQQEHAVAIQQLAQDGSSSIVNIGNERKQPQQEVAPANASGFDGAQRGGQAAPVVQHKSTSTLLTTTSSGDTLSTTLD